MLRALAATGVELVGVDTSMTLTYRSEYGMLPEGDRPPPVLLVQEWLARHKDAIPRALRTGGEYLLLPHCSERADRKSTRLNSSHANISYAVFCLKKKKKYYKV